MVRKIVIIVAVLIILSTSGVVAWWQWGGGQAILSPAPKASPSPSPKTEVTIDTLNWEDPAGFSFDYNKLFKVNTNPGDEINYADLTFNMDGKVGLINIIVNDFSYKDLEQWLAQDKTVNKGSALDTTVAGVPAKKVALKDGVMVTGLVDSDNVLYLVTLQPGEDKDFWRNNYEKILSSFKFVPLEGEDENSLRLQPASTEESGGGDENTIIEEEETIE
jgi:hypothetical protein